MFAEEGQRGWNPAEYGETLKNCRAFSKIY